MPYGEETGEPVMLALGEDYPELRGSVRKICEKYPGAYWRKLRGRAGLSDRIRRRADRGRLSRLADPRGIWRLGAAAARRRGDPRGDQRLGLHRRARATPRCTSWAPLLRHGSAEQKQRYLPRHRLGRVAPPGVRRHRADDRLRHDQAQDPRGARSGDHYVVHGQKVWTSRARHSDLMLLLARTTPVEEVQAPHRRALGVPRRPAREPGHGARDPPDRGDDQPQHHRGVLRQSEVPAENLIGEEGKGFRYILDGMNAERILVAAGMHRRRRWLVHQGHRLRQGAGRLRPADRAEPGRAVSARARLCRDWRRPT